MSRPKLYQTNSEKQRAYRERNGVSDLDRLQVWREDNPARYLAQKKRTRLKAIVNRRERRMFVAIDGEGITKNTDQYAYTSGKEERVASTHYYTLLTACNEFGVGDYIENYNGLSTIDCFEFLLQLDFPDDAIYCGFAFNYDANMILKDLDEITAEKLWKDGQANWGEYHIMWLPTKSLTISDRNGDRSIHIYDTFGFFQKSFEKTLIDFGFEIPKEITEGKKDRIIFSIKQKETIRYYNQLECELLCKIMNKLRDALICANMLPDRWHGPGAIASKLFHKHQIKDCNAMPQKYWKEIVAAYYGGRNQMLKQGELGDVFAHDIRSAYPFAMKDLPTSIGEWKETKVTQDYLYEYGLHYVSWDLSKYKDNRITPFPLRSKGRIFWTIKGSGWYWTPEVSIALDYYSKGVKIERTIQFYPDTEEKPFCFITDLYEQRKRFVKEGNDAQLAIKLALNSAYGKCAQSIGYKGLRPIYQNHFWAGYLTSITRARMFELAIQNSQDVIFFATDGLFAKKQLLERIEENLFGGWEVKMLKNFFALQSGVYTFDTEENDRKYKSRGFHYKSVDYDAVRQEWKRKGIYGEYDYEETRFIGMGVALQRDFNLRCRWLTEPRKLNFMPIGEFDDMQRKIWTAIDIYPPSIDVIESESYKLKQNWFEDAEWLSIMDSLRR